MYILFNSWSGTCLNVGSDIDKAFDCFLAGAIIAGATLTETVEDYRNGFRSTQNCSYDNVYLFNSNMYAIVDGELVAIN